MTGVAIIKVSTPQAAILQIGSTATTITRLESRALVLQGVEGVGPPGPQGDPGADGPSDHGLLTGLGDDDHPQYVLDAGDTMTGTLTQTAASTTTPATRVNVSADTGYRMWIYGSGKVAWAASHYDGPASAPRVTLIPWSESTVLHQAWTTFATDNASLTTNVLAVQVGNGGQPTIVMQSHGGTQASPTATTSGTTLGEVAFRGSVGTTGYGDEAPGAIVGWSGAAIRGWAVEGWAIPTNFGGMLTFETVPRASGAGRQESVVLYDGGQFVLDPAGQLGVLFGTYTLPAARLTVVSQATTETTAVLKAKASQTAKVLEVQDSSGTVVASITAAGVGAFAAGTTIDGDDPFDRANHTGSQLASTISDFTEAAQDAVGAAVTDTSSIDFTYTDASNTITADIKTAGVTNTMLAPAAGLGRIHAIAAGVY